MQVLFKKMKKIYFLSYTKKGNIDFYVKTMYFYVMAKIWDAITADDLPTDDLSG